MIFVAALLAGLFQVATPDPAPSTEERAQLEKGEVVVEALPPSDDSGVAARARALVDAPPDAVWPVVRDCEHFSEFMPRTKRSRLLQRSFDEAVCEIEVAMPFPLSNLVSTTRSKLIDLPGGGHERRWTLVSGDYRRNEGVWRVLPWGPDGKRTFLEYRLDADPTTHVPDALIRRAQTGSLPDVLEAVRKRVKGG
jgi:ribosome-associated toxin RatA of RatAB toxin-antitoxin module